MVVRELRRWLLSEPARDDDELIPYKEVKAGWRERQRLRREGPLGTRAWIGLKDCEFALTRRIDDARDVPKVVRSSWQRGRRGWADRDVWNFEDYLARVIAEGVEYHRLHCVSDPDFSDASTPEQWDAILIEIRDGFHALAAMGQTDEEAYQRGMKRFAEWFRLLWD